VPALSGFLSFDPALSYQLGRRCPARPRSVQVRPEHRGIRAKRPARALAAVAPGPGSCPTSRRATSGGAARTRLPGAVLAGQVPPRAPGPGPEQDPVDPRPVIVPQPARPPAPRQQRLQPRPLLIGQVMTPPVIIHGK